jgi:ribosome-associated protein
MIEVTGEIRIDEAEVEFQFVRSSGPGGQNVNKVATAVQMRFDARNSPSLPDAVRERLIKLAGSRITREGVLIITARRFRTQDRNRADVLERFVQLVERASRPVVPRKPTRPSTASRERRLKEKQQRSEKKRLRGTLSDD